MFLLALCACSAGQAKVTPRRLVSTGVVDLKASPDIYEKVLSHPGTGKVYPAFPIKYEEEVDRFVEFYSTNGRGHVDSTLERKNKYSPLLKAIFAHYGLPIELVNVVAIESKFMIDAESPSGAYGLWQFMPATARSEGLEVSMFTDERGDVVKSTIAAARHFQKLYDKFGDWYLALAAYNGGMARISRAVNAAGSRDIFEIIRSDRLCKETAEYVPKIVAVTLIMRDLDLYGFLPKKILYAAS
jgi:membrane-bound lytic murein transglycosylase D